MSKMETEQSVKNTISMLMVGFQSPGIILWSRHSIGGLSCLGGGLRSLSALIFLFFFVLSFNRSGAVGYKCHNIQLYTSLEERC